MTQEGDDVYLLTEVASLYYEENYTQEQIAKVMGVSRSGVSRMLTRSRELGLVDIHVHHPLRTSVPLRDELIHAFNIQDAQVLLSTSSPDIDGPEIARQLANTYGGRCYYLHAPLLVADPIVRDGLLKERSLRRSFQMMEQMDMALVGIGGARPEASGLFRAGYLSENELQVIRSQGAVGDMCGCYFDIDGRICDIEMLNRTIAVSFDTLRKVPLVIAVAAGVAKTEAILGALRTGIIKVLVTDEPCARAVLNLTSRREFVESPG